MDADDTDLYFGGNCTSTNDRPDGSNPCGYHDRGDNPDDEEGYYCTFTPSAVPAQCRWPISVHPSARPGRASTGGFLYPRWPYPRYVPPIGRAATYLTIGSTTASPPASPQPSGTTAGGLPVTGTSLPWYAGVAAALLGAGAALLVLARRRTTRSG
ncbi:LPXTG cell wall anchor domain-containing protein [Actinocatenispora rupis]|uniref:Gram-positive cocci surface proteins LPxTG domain-containing protein n=1 Tax=Actinocatenispora rupis TaxID=519421 RepID=A0A8J3JJX1_9ACTN|nr:LPXTG cell wall anchor domain-containing protein [Actinocatenispora rupis]GID16278.1 hypothetical protein Aru02nite_71670 [Actinocatenispora rupis]